ILFLATGTFGQCAADYSPPCQVFSRTPLVFVATVTRTSFSPTYQRGEGNDVWNYRDRVAHLTIETIFRGKLGPEVDIVATEILPTPITLPNGQPGSKMMSDWDCDYTFKQGGRYLVYAYPRKTNDGTLTVPFNRTRLMADAADDLAYIRGLSDAPPGGRI